MIRRLVQQQQIRISEKYLGETCAHHPTAAELAHRTSKIALLNTQPRKNRLRLVLTVATACRLQLLVQRRHAIQQPTLLFTISLPRQRLPHCRDLVHQRVDFHTSIQNLFQQRLVAKRLRLLSHIADIYVALSRNITRIRIDLARQNIQ